MANECGGCEQIEYKPVTLRTGETVCSSCESWRHECEARTVLEKMTLSDRQAYLAGVDKVRGLKAGERLRAEVRAQWEARKAAA